jgi:hypothetical protein
LPWYVENHLAEKDTEILRGDVAVMEVVGLDDADLWNADAAVVEVEGLSPDLILLSTLALMPLRTDLNRVTLLS